MAIEEKKVGVGEKKKPTTPWKPANIIDVATKFKKPDFRLHWARTDQIDKKITEGWELVRSERPEDISPERAIIDGKSPDGTVRKRNLILMQMPEEMAQARAEYHKNLTEMSVKNKTKQFAQDTTVDGSQTSYGEIKITQGGGK